MASKKFHLHWFFIIAAVIFLFCPGITRANSELHFYYLHLKKSPEKCFIRDKTAVFLNA